MVTSQPDAGLRIGLNDDRIGDDGVNQLKDGRAERVREVREDLYGAHGSHLLADALGIPRETWIDYENGLAIPSFVILRLIHLSGVSGRWLITGRGTKYPRDEFDIRYRMRLDSFLDREDRT
jgi:hypothetical protein